MSAALLPHGWWLRPPGDGDLERAREALLPKYPRTVSFVADQGDGEATQEERGGDWLISYPGGDDRFAGSLSGMRRRVIELDPTASFTSEGLVGGRPSWTRGHV